MRHFFEINELKQIRIFYPINLCSRIEHINPFDWPHTCFYSLSDNVSYLMALAHWHLTIIQTHKVRRFLLTEHTCPSTCISALGGVLYSHNIKKASESWEGFRKSCSIFCSKQSWLLHYYFFSIFYLQIQLSKILLTF